jgi:Ca2+-binding RTX toxin-like protein
LGDGADKIKDFDRTANNHDKIILGEGISREQLDFKRVGSNMVITLNDQDSITIQKWYASYDRFKIEEIVFNDGSQMSLKEMEDSSAIRGDEINNRLKGSNANDVIFGFNGKDKLYGYNGDDKLYGGQGNDLIYADKGSDIIIGGKGNDYLNGGKGDDTYYFSLGDGVDKIKDFDRTANNHDKIVLGSGIERDDVVFMMDKKNLIISYSDEDSIKILRQSNDRSKIEEIALSDGSYISSKEIDKIIQSINAYASEKGLEIDSIDDVKKSQEMMQIISNSWH